MIYRAALFFVFLIVNMSIYAQTPANDDKINATLITLDSSGDYCSANNQYSIIGATGDGIKPSGWNSNPSQNVWFKFSAPASGEVKASVIITSTSGINYPRLALWDNAGNPVIAKGYVGLRQSLGVQARGLVPGDEYFISVGGWNGTTHAGTFKLCLTDEVDNDFQDKAVLISDIDNVCLSGYSTNYATADGSRPSDWNSNPKYNVWFKFKPKASGEVKIDVSVVLGQADYPRVALFDDNGNEIASRGYLALRYAVGVSAINLDPTRFYYISVGTWGGSNRNGKFKICLDDEVAYDFAHKSKQIADVTNYCTSNTNANSTGDGPKPSQWQGNPGDNVWYKFTPPNTGEVTISVTVGSTVQIDYPRIAVFDSNFQEVASIGRGSFRQSRTLKTRIEDASQEYYITVGAYGGSTKMGKYNMCASFISDPLCTTELWAISSGSWDDPNIWSDTEGGVATDALPCDQTIVYIKGFDVTFNSVNPVETKRIELIGTSANTNTRLNIQSGELNVIENIQISGPGANLKGEVGASVKVTGTGSG